jgi:hypothetical protein
MKHSEHNYLEIDNWWHIFQQLLGNKQLIVIIPPARHIGYSSKAHIGSSNMSSFGRLEQRLNARYMPGSYCTTKSKQHAIYKKRGWPHQEHCVLCNGLLETGLYLSLLCHLTKTVRDQVIAWENFVVRWPQQEPTSVAEWREQATSKIQKQDRECFNGMMIYIMWNLWKERNRRIFENMHRTTQQVVLPIKEKT